MTRVGYSGGTSASPSYYKLGDHTEVVDIYFDPAVASFHKLLNHFLKCRDHSAAKTSLQYKSIVLCHDQGQFQLASTVIAEEEKISNKKLLISIQMFDQFYIAENKHQKNSLRRHPGLINFCMI